MKTIIALLALGVAAVTAAPQNSQRIVGGSVTTIDRYPSIVSLLYSHNMNSWWQTCGGIILNSRHVLTAAHCPHGDAVARWRVRSGSTWANSGGVVHLLEWTRIHPDYNRNTVDSDIAMLRTITSIAFNNNAQAAFIAGANYNLGDNQVVWAAGWGDTAFQGSPSEQLRHVQVWTINQAACQQRYNAIRQTITANMLCSGVLDVGGRDQCQGDSGGPLYHNNIVVGVTSWGEGCADSRFPGVNVRVSRFTSWIQSNA